MTLRQYRFSWSWMSGVALLGSVLQLPVARSAHAEEDSATETGAARTLAVDGLKLAQAGKCEDAIPKLERAEKLHHSAIVLSHLGECQVNEGKLVDGTENLRKVLREPLPANPTPALSKAYERAQTVLDAARPHIAALTVSIGSMQVPDMRLLIDGQVVPATLLDTEIPADPGDHLIEASAPGFLKTSAHVSLASADKKTVTLKLDSDPNAPPAAPPAPPLAANANLAAQPVGPANSSASSVSAPPALPPEPPSHAAAYVSWGVGVVGVGVGAAFGVIAMQDKHDLNGRCSGNTCPQSSQDAVDSAKRAGNISTIAFG